LINVIGSWLVCARDRRRQHGVCVQTDQLGGEKPSARPTSCQL